MTEVQRYSIRDYSKLMLQLILTPKCPSKPDKYF